MSEEKDRRFAALNEMVERVIAALSGEDGRINADLAADALAFVMAVQIDLDPRIALPSQIRQAAEEHGAVVQRYARFLRKHFEETGRHFGEEIGGEVTVTGELPAGHTRH